MIGDPWSHGHGYIVAMVCLPGSAYVNNNGSEQFWDSLNLFGRPANITLSFYIIDLKSLHIRES